MSPLDFHDLFRTTIAEVGALFAVKNGEYASAVDTDSLSNFKEAGKRQDVIPEKVLMVYLDKHFAAISNFVSDLAKGRTRPRSEGIEGRINDMILYGIFLRALLAERHELQEAVEEEVRNDPLRWEDEE